MQLAMREWRMGAAWRGLVAAAVVGLLLGFTGPFGSQTSLAPLVRYGFWMAISLTGHAAALAADRLLPRSGRPMLRLAAVALVSALPMTFVAAWAMGLVRPGRSFTPLQLVALFPYVALVQALLARVAMAAPPAADAPASAPPAPIEHASPDPAPCFPADFLSRLPASCRHGIVALEAEDHYLRVHAGDGSALVLMRLADAAAQFDPRLGLRVHRSWWVALDAVEALETGPRPSIRLANGKIVPVSRSYLADTRAALG